MLSIEDISSTNLILSIAIRSMYAPQTRNDLYHPIITRRQRRSVQQCSPYSIPREQLPAARRGVWRALPFTRVQGPAGGPKTTPRSRCDENGSVLWKHYTQASDVVVVVGEYNNRAVVVVVNRCGTQEVRSRFCLSSQSPPRVTVDSPQCRRRRCGTMGRSCCCCCLTVHVFRGSQWNWRGQPVG